jgi:hypothetical protein
MKMTLSEILNRRERLKEPPHPIDGDPVFKVIQTTMIGAFIALIGMTVLGAIAGQGR